MALGLSNVESSFDGSIDESTKNGLSDPTTSFNSTLSTERASRGREIEMRQDRTLRCSSTTKDTSSTPLISDFASTSSSQFYEVLRENCASYSAVIRS